MVGNTASSCCGYNVNKRIAYAYLPVWFRDPGNEVLVELMGKKHNRAAAPKSLVQMEVTRARLTKKKQKKTRSSKLAEILQNYSIVCVLPCSMYFPRNGVGVMLLIDGFKEC